MAPEAHFGNPFFPNDRSLAAQIVEASHAEHTHIASSKPKKHSKKMESDAASVSSFGSTIGLLKNKFHHSSAPSSSSSAERKAPASMQKKILRNQVNIVG